MRPLTLQDVAWLVPLADSLFAPWEDGYGQVVARWLTLDNSRGWAAVLPGTEPGAEEPVGFILLGSLGLVGPARAHVLEVLALGVSAQRARQGFGRALLAQALRHARAEGAMEIRLTVAEGNHPARALFEQAGFTVQRSDDGTFSKGARAVRLRWLPR